MPNAVAHFDVAGPEFDLLSAFYSSVFGWSVESRGPGYASVTTPEGSMNGALIESQQAALTIGIVVSELARSLDVAVAQSGTLAMPVMDNGWVVKAQILDPAGSRITLIQA